VNEQPQPPPPGKLLLCKKGEKMTANSKLLFCLGRLVATPGAIEALMRDEITDALARHSQGDWGEVCEADYAENQFALNKYLRLFSVYQSKNGDKFWIITEADRSATTVLLPDEY
jgi:hypothetical protein